MQDPQNTVEKKPSTQASHETQNDPQNHTVDTPVADAGSVSASGNDNRKVSREDIELVRQSLSSYFCLDHTLESCARGLLTS